MFALFLYSTNFINVLSNMFLLYSVFVDSPDIQTIAFATQSFQIADLAFSTSNPIVLLTQTCAKSFIAYYGQPDYMRWLALVWGTSDLIRYMYHIAPSIAIIKRARYSQYKLLYPVGISLELMTLLPVLSHNSKIIVSALYIVIFPMMFNHTNKLESKVYLLELLDRLSKSSNEKDVISVEFNKRTYSVSHKLLVYNLSDTRYKLKVVNNIYLLKDPGLIY